MDPLRIPYTVSATHQYVLRYCLPNGQSTHVTFSKVQKEYGIHIHDTCIHVWRNQLYECLRKNVISTLKINIFLKFNNQWNGGYLLVPLIFEFKIKKYFKKRYDAFYKTPVQISFENHHFLKFKNQRNSKNLVLLLVVKI